MKTLNLEQFARLHNLITEADYSSECHSMASPAQLNVSRAKKRANTRLLNTMLEEIKNTKRLYEEAILKGEIVRPRELGVVERLLRTAQGDSNLTSTKAAKRALRSRISRGNIECPVCGNAKEIENDMAIATNSICRTIDCWLCVQ